ncbi:DUF2254 family protein [Deinococcus alpinitundrae]|uniref:DUF2254 family protein n=1 Tax=Deinococcus alpinitundrae TaxID=468913 RepID=UPI0013798DED|nr:DUF2254 family protein [Deinococcus alpinitundrae]
MSLTVSATRCPACQTAAGPTASFTGVDQLRLVLPVTDFSVLLARMFDMIRQCGRGIPSVVIRLLEVLTVSASCLHDQEGRAVSRHHADLLREDALCITEGSGDRADIEARYSVLRQLLLGNEGVLRR